MFILFNEMNFKKIQPPHFIEKSIRENMKKREKAFVIFLYQKQYTKSQIMDKLYIDNDRNRQRLKRKVRNIIAYQNVA